MQTRSNLWLWRILWGINLLLGLGIFVLYAWLPVDGATGDLESFRPEGFRVQWLLEEREAGLRVGDLIVRAGGHTADEWLDGARRGPEWHPGGIIIYEVLRDGQTITLPIRLAPVSFGAILARWWPQLLTSLFLILIGSFVFWKRPHEPAARLLMLFCITMAMQLWGDAYNFQYAILTRRWIFWLHFFCEYSLFILSYASVLHFVMVFPTPNPLIERFPGLTCLAIYALHPLIILLVTVLSSPWSESLRAGSHISWRVALIQAVLAIVLGLRSVRTARDPVSRSQIRWIFWGASIAISVSIPLYILPLALIGHPLVPHPLIMLGTAFIPLIFAIPILRYHLFDIEIIINRTLVYGTLTLLLGGLYLLLVPLLTLLIQIVLRRTSDTLVVFIATLGIALAFAPLRQRMQTVIDRAFYREKVDFQQALFTFSREVRTLIELPGLLGILVNRVTDLLHITHSAIFLQNADGIFQLVRARNLPSEDTRPLSLDDATLEQLQSSVVIPRPEDPTFSLLVPLIVPRSGKSNLIGVLALGPLLSGQNYSRDDRTLLMGLADQAGTAIYVAQLIEEKQAEALQKEQAKAANRAKSIFLANMSHELRTPLNAILGFSEMMTRDSNLNAEQQDNLNMINRSGEYLLSLINDVLELSKIETGRAQLETENFDLHNLLVDLEEMFRLQAELEGLALILDKTPDLPRYVRADRGKLRQVLINLIGNAIKFTREGSVTLRVRPTSAPTHTSPTLRFEVQDTGVGIAPAELDDAFDIFVQTSSGRVSEQGSGLGIPISQRFVRMMGGDLTVSSEPGEGSVFCFEILVELADAPNVQTTQPTRRVTRVELDPNRAVPRLLIVEDNEANRKLLVKLLQTMNFEIGEATNGREAIQAWEEWDPHLIWMDIRMPVMDGYEATRRIKATAKGQNTIIVALTASAFEEERQMILSSGCDDFIRKPFREAEIFDTLARHLDVRFVYEETEMERERRDRDSKQDAPEQPAQDLVPSALLMTLPPNWRANLRQATIDADFRLMLALIEQIAEFGDLQADTISTLTGSLTDLVYSFDYETIRRLIDQL